MLVDSHCHLDFPDFAEELDQVVARASLAGIGRMVTISTRVRRFAGVRAIAEHYDPVYCSVGTHPHNAHEELDVTAQELAQLSEHPKAVAIGEAGLDYFYDNSPRNAQAEGLRTHIAAARATGLPLVIHAVLESNRMRSHHCGWPAAPSRTRRSRSDAAPARSPPRRTAP